MARRGRQGAEVCRAEQAGRHSCSVAPQPSADRLLDRGTAALAPRPTLPGLRPPPLSWQNGTNHQQTGGDSPVVAPVVAPVSHSLVRSDVHHAAKAPMSWRASEGPALSTGPVSAGCGDKLSCGAGPGDLRAVEEGLCLPRSGFFPEPSVLEQTTPRTEGNRVLSALLASGRLLGFTGDRTGLSCEMQLRRHPHLPGAPRRG